MLRQNIINLMEKKNKIFLGITISIALFYFYIQTGLLFNFIWYNDTIGWLSYISFLTFVPFFVIIVKNHISEFKKTTKNLSDFESMVHSSVLISKADKNGKIVYVNKRFEEVSGWSMEEVIGKNHNVVNSGVHPKEFWKNMYRTVIVDRKIWNSICTNRTKGGEIYHVDTFIKAEFDEYNKLIGFTSIRYDVTEIVQLNDKLNSLLSTQTSYVLRTDMQGRHTYWNQKFEDDFGWVYESKMMHGDSLLSICESHHDIARKSVMECISNPGKIVKVELDKPHSNGSRITTLWEFVCLTDKSLQPTEVQCMGIDITDRVRAEKEIELKNVYLEHAAKILRHDMHSGINTYIPRGITSLKRRLSSEIIENLKLNSPLKLLEDGLSHAQKVYKSVYEFTNLVKKDSVLNKEKHNLSDILNRYLITTPYNDQVIVAGWLPSIEVNEPLFCTALDNLVRNGLKYNDSETKVVKIYMEDDEHLSIQDNGRGMTNDEFILLSEPYRRRDGQKETGTGLGLNICVAILKEHGFDIHSEKNEIGTKIKIKIK